MKNVNRDTSRLVEVITENPDNYHYYTGVANYVADVMELSDEDNVGIIIKVLKKNYGRLERLGFKINWKYVAEQIVVDKEYAKELEK